MDVIAEQRRAAGVILDLAVDHLPLYWIATHLPKSDQPTVLSTRLYFRAVNTVSGMPALHVVAIPEGLLSRMHLLGLGHTFLLSLRVRKRRRVWTRSSQPVHAQGLGAEGACHVGLHVPGGEESLGQAAQLINVAAMVDGPGLGLQGELAGERVVAHRESVIASKCNDLPRWLGARGLREAEPGQPERVTCQGNGPERRP